MTQRQSVEELRERAVFRRQLQEAIQRARLQAKFYKRVRERPEALYCEAEAERLRGWLHLLMGREKYGRDFG